MTQRRILSVALPFLSTDRLGPAEAPQVTWVMVGGRALVEAVDPAAAAAGLQPGTNLADARALEPALIARPADPAADQRLLFDLADWAGRYTPWTAADGIARGAGGLLLDITGCGHLFGGEPALLQDLLGWLTARGLAARGAIADSVGAAWALARFAPEPNPVVTGDAGRRALEALPIRALRLAAAEAIELERFGLGRIGELAGIARGPLTARFGAEPVRRLDQALGRLAEPITPRRPVPRYLERLAFAEPIMTLESSAAGIRHLLGLLERRLEAAGKGARRVEAAVWRLDGAVRRLAVGTHRPVRAAAALWKLIEPHLEKLDPTVGIELMTLGAVTVEPLAPEQLAFEAGAAQVAGSAAPLIDRLINRLGSQNVLRLVPRESHVPERAQRLLPLLEAPPARPAVARPRPRPIRLFARPEPLDGIMAEVPDHPPAQFRWRGQVHRVALADGPERIEPEWWLEDRRSRDYYLVEDAEGRRFWLFRYGAFADPEPVRWYLHGLF